jgi:hypothetical protein
LDNYSLGLHSILRSGGIYSAVERFQVSMDALFQLATRESARPARKIILWISPGWPILSGPSVEQQMDPKQQQQNFSDVVKLSTLLRQGRMAATSKRGYRVRREKAVIHSGGYPPGNWFAPPGSNQSSSGGNETAEASGAESR